jgi:hypothetical protein
MKITQQFFEQFLDGNDFILDLGTRVLKLEILFNVNKGTIPITTLLRSFTSDEVEFFLEIGIMEIDSSYAYNTSVFYTQDAKLYNSFYPPRKPEPVKPKKPAIKLDTRTW